MDNKPNLLFYYRNKIVPSNGGVERVVDTMFRELSNIGYKIFVIYQYDQDGDSNIRQFKLPDSSNRISIINKEYFIDFIIRNNVDIVLNFGAISNTESIDITEAVIKTNAKLISIYHNQIDYALYGNKVLMKLLNNVILKKILKILYREIQCAPFFKNARYILKHSDAGVVLSPCYIEQLKFYTKHSDKFIVAIENPIPQNSDFKKYDRLNKSALFVGRLSKQKNIERLIKVWSQLPCDYTLDIIGDGEEKQYLLRIIESKGLKNVYIHGTKDPTEFYKTRQILCMTSLFEGLPMVLLECQQYGCVPVIMETFPSARDIIKDGYNGFCVNCDNRKDVVYVEKIKAVFSGDNVYERMSDNCRIMSSNYISNAVVKKWVNLFHIISQ